MKILAVITEPPVTDRILRHLRTAGIPDPFDDARPPPEPPPRATTAVPPGA